MAKISDVEIPSLLMDDQGSDPSTPASGFSRIYTKADGAYVIDDAGNVTGPLAEAAAATPIANRVIFVTHPSYTLSLASNATPTASAAYAWPLVIPGQMRLRTATFHMQAAASGTYQWGLFDITSSSSAATKLAGGSGTLNGTGAQSIAASGGPINIDPGTYMFILHAPASNGGSMYRAGANTSGLIKSQTSYVWDDTPDFTTGWSISVQDGWVTYLRGDLDGTNQW